MLSVAIVAVFASILWTTCCAGAPTNWNSHDITNGRHGLCNHIYQFISVITVTTRREAFKPSPGRFVSLQLCVLSLKGVCKSVGGVYTRVYIILLWRSYYFILYVYYYYFTYYNFIHNVNVRYFQILYVRKLNIILYSTYTPYKHMYALYYNNITQRTL